MQVNPKIRKANSRSKRREAMLMGFKLIINNQGQFITEIKNYPLDKVSIFQYFGTGISELKDLYIPHFVNKPF